jgi:hypothetical protein
MGNEYIGSIFTTQYSLELQDCRTVEESEWSDNGRIRDADRSGCFGDLFAITRYCKSYIGSFSEYVERIGMIDALFSILC